jgi:hypothetical protein
LFAKSNDKQPDKHGTIVAFLRHARYQGSPLFFPVNRHSIYTNHPDLRCFSMAIGLSAVSGLVVLDQDYHYAFVDWICLPVSFIGILFLS